MALRVPSWLSDVLRWRWLPTIALVLASLLYVLFALAFVPTDIRFSAASPSPSALPGGALGAMAPSGAEEEEPIEAAGTLEEPQEPTKPRRRRRPRRRAEPAAEAPAAEAPEAP